MIDPVILTLLGIGVFTLGIVAGYITGWEHGASRGFDVGWKASVESVRKQIEAIKKT